MLITNISETQTDARCFLAGLLTRPVRAIVNGEERNLRIVGEEHNLFNRYHTQVSEWNDEPDNCQRPTHQVDFWDDEHGTREGDKLKLEVPGKRFDNFADVLEGTITEVKDQKVF